MLDIGYEIKDLAKDVGEDLIEKIEEQGDEVFGDFIRDFNKMSKEARETLTSMYLNDYNFPKYYLIQSYCPN